MARFECTMCGRCCASLGRLIAVERELGGADFYCRNAVTRELALVHIEAAYREAFEDETIREQHPDWCRFLRRNPAGAGYVCACYGTRPRICREYVCATMRISDAAGVEVGRVGRGKTLLTEDEGLKRCWTEQAGSIAAPDEKAWLRQMKEALERAGYHAVIFD